MIPTGLALRGAPRGGREAQSTAFFITPGTPWLYSGVTMRMPPASVMARLNAVTLGGSPRGLHVAVVKRDGRQIEDIDAQARWGKFSGCAKQGTIQGRLPQAAGDAENIYAFAHRAASTAG